MITLLLVLCAFALTGTDYVMVARNGGVDAQTFDGLNAAHGTDKLSLYNRSWGATVNPNQFNILVTVNDDRIVAVRSYGVTGAVSIPSDDWVIAANGVRLPLLGGLAVEDTLLVRPTYSCSGFGVPVVMFHDLGATSDNFDATLSEIESEGYETITQAQLRDWMNGNDGLPGKPIMLTFDDGYASHFSYAPALLNDYGMVGTFFIITSRPGTGSAWATWTAIEDGFENYPDAVELGCHSHNAHFQTNGVDRYLLMTEAERIADLNTCIDRLELHTGVTPTTIAWPFGGYDEALVDDAQAAGLSLIFTTQEGLNHPDNADGQGHVRRYGANVSNAWSVVETTMSHWRVCENE